MLFQSGQTVRSPTHHASRLTHILLLQLFCYEKRHARTLQKSSKPRLATEDLWKVGAPPLPRDIAPAKWLTQAIDLATQHVQSQGAGKSEDLVTGGAAVDIAQAEAVPVGRPVKKRQKLQAAKASAAS